MVTCHVRVRGFQVVCVPCTISIALMRLLRFVLAKWRGKKLVFASPLSPPWVITSQKLTPAPTVFPIDFTCPGLFGLHEGGQIKRRGTLRKSLTVQSDGDGC